MKTFFTIDNSFFKTALLYVVLFMVVFNLFFTDTFTDGHETTNIFGLESFFLSVGIVVFYAILQRAIGSPNIFNNLFVNTFSLYLLSEFTFFIFFQEPSLFGVLYKYRFNKGATDILKFREVRNYSLSMSFLYACSTYFFLKLLFGRSNGNKKTD